MFKALAIATLSAASLAQLITFDQSPCGSGRFDNGFNSFDRGIGNFRGVNDLSLRNRNRGCFGTVEIRSDNLTPFVGGPAFG